MQKDRPLQRTANAGASTAEGTSSANHFLIIAWPLGPIYQSGTVYLYSGAKGRPRGVDKADKEGATTL